MKYTHISLPGSRRVTFHRFVMGTFLIISFSYIAGMLALTYLSTEEKNAELNAKLNSYTNKTNVSAPIVTPSAEKQQSSLEPVDKTEVIELLNKVNTLALLPGDESPTLATVTDISQLEKDAFFRNGLNGDKLFVYQKAGMVVLYRPSEGRLVNMGNIAGATGRVQGVMTKKASDEASLKKVTVAVYYTSDDMQKQDTFMGKLTQVPDIDVIKQSYTRKTDYKEVVVIGLTDAGRGSVYKEVLKATNGTEEVKIPEGEEMEGADIAIIVGE